MSRGLTGAKQNRHNGNTPPAQPEQGGKASSRRGFRCTWVPRYCHSRRGVLFVHPLQVSLAQGSDHQPMTPVPAPATSPIDRRVKGQGKVLQYTQKQSSATVECVGAENRTRAAAHQTLLGLWHPKIGQIHQKESLWCLQNIGADAVVSPLTSLPGG